MSISKEHQFTTTFSKYSVQTDKFESLYIFVIYKLNYDPLVNNITRILHSIESIPDNKKKYYLSTRIKNFIEYIKINYEPESLINGIFLIDTNINYEPMDNYYIDTLEQFVYNNFSYKYGCEYPLDWLKDLVLDRKYINVIKVKNNDFTYSKLNSSKKFIVSCQTIKSMDLKQLITNQIPKTEPYIVHGVSVNLKNFTDKNAVHISTQELTDESILLIYKSIDIKKIHQELNQVLINMSDTKFYNRIVFGQEIKDAIKNNLLETLFCTEQIYNKIPQQFRNFNVKIVSQLEKFDIGEKLQKEYSGAIGIKYY
jgi:hypothetical protein